MSTQPTSTQREFSSDLKIIEECSKVLSDDNELSCTWEEESFLNYRRGLPGYGILLDTVEAGHRLAKRKDSKTTEPSYETMEAEEFEDEVSNLENKSCVWYVFYIYLEILQLGSLVRQAADSTTTSSF